MTYDAGHLDFTGSRGEINPETHYDLISLPDISNGPWEHIMRGSIRCWFMIAALCCVAMFAADSAPLQMADREPGYDSIKGQSLYIANCSACHQSTGEGLPGAFPPLKGSNVVNKDDASKHIQVILNGMKGGRVGGMIYVAPMPPFAGALSDTAIADIIDYERSSWGNHGKPVTEAQVAAERARPK
jgi:mono/diheme cytochrome c family protein